MRRSTSRVFGRVVLKIGEDLRKAFGVALVKPVSASALEETLGKHLASVA
jgi:hypothetical protein